MPGNQKSVLLSGNEPNQPDISRIRTNAPNMMIENLSNIAGPVAVFSIFAGMAGFYLYFYPAHAGWTDRIGQKSPNPDTGLLIRFLFRKIWGFLAMGLVPAFAWVLLLNRPVSSFGLTVDDVSKYWPWLLLTIAIPILLNAFLARNPKTHEMYPQLRIRNWTPGLFTLNALGWFFYLLGYEYLFRGVLLFGVYEDWGFWGAIATNTALYSLAHFNKGIGETLGAIPFGILLCLISLTTGTIWFALMAHLSLALSNDYFSIRYNPEMGFTKQKERL